MRKGSRHILLPLYSKMLATEHFQPMKCTVFLRAHNVEKKCKASLTSLSGLWHQQLVCEKI